MENDGNCDSENDPNGEVSMKLMEDDGSEDGTEGSRTSLQEGLQCTVEQRPHPRVTPPVDWISRICRISIKLVAFGTHA